MKSQYTIEEINIEDLSEKHFNQLLQIYIEHNERYNYPLPRDSEDSIKKSMIQKNQFETNRRRYVAIHSESDEIHSYCHIVTNIGKTNRQSAYGRLISLKSKQKQGIGKKLIASSIKDIPEDVKKLGFSIRSDDTKRDQKPDSLLDLYLQSIGGKFVLSERKSGSKISSFDKNDVKMRASELLRKAEKTGFEIYFVEAYNFKEQSNFSYPKYLKALEGIWNDMPRDDSSEEDWELSEELHQDFYQRGKLQNHYPWTFIAVNSKTKEIAGMTESWILRNRSDVVLQDDTGVVKQYRGNGLGLMLKFQMLEKLLVDDETKNVDWWTTFNTHSNEHMLKINDELNYEELATFNNYEFEVEELRKYLDIL